MTRPRVVHSWFALSAAVRRGGSWLVSILLVGVSLDARQALEVMRFGMSPGVVEGVSPTDARAASMLWAEGISGAMGLFKSAEATIFTSSDDAIRAMADGRVQMAVLTSLEYLDIEHRIACTPLMVYEVQGQFTQEFVLLARVPAAAHPPASATITVYTPNPGQNLPTLWADTHFSEQGVKGGLAAFAQVRPIDKRGRATTAVFFGQSDYGVDTRSAFESAVELNPQVGRDVVVVARSPQLLPGVICASNGMSATRRQQFLDRAVHLHEQVRYQQSMVIMRLTRLVAWQPGMLDTTRALVARHAALTRKGHTP